MNKVLMALIGLAFFCCKDEAQELTAQDIVDKSITIAGGELYEVSKIKFDFRDRTYISEMEKKQKTLKRIQKDENSTVVDVLSKSGFERYQNDSLIILHDSMKTKYGNSVNSVHYFSKLPYGLNDKAVHKELLGEASIKGKVYHKVKVTFSEEGGGDDFDDTYIYFFNKKTFKPDYLAYDFHVDGGGMRFREAYNERYVNGIRFVDYKNMKPIDSNVSVLQVDSLFNANGLKLLSKIELKNIEVTF